VAIKKYWGRVKFVAIHVGHASSTTLLRTLAHLTTALSTVCPPVEQARANRGAIDPDTDSHAKSHDYRLFKSLLVSPTTLARSRLLGIDRNMKRLVETLPRAFSRHRAHSAATPTHTQTALQQRAAIHIHKTRTT
jgi:hypothetical protein